MLAVSFCSVPSASTGVAGVAKRKRKWIVLNQWGVKHDNEEQGIKVAHEDEVGALKCDELKGELVLGENFLSPVIDGVGSCQTTMLSKGGISVDTFKFGLSSFDSVG